MKFLLNIRDLFQKILEIQKSRKKKITYGISIFFLISFVLGIVSGAYVTLYEPSVASQTVIILRQRFVPIISEIRGGQLIVVALEIFSHNLSVSALVTLLGFSIILTFPIIFLMGFGVGFIMGIAFASASSNLGLGYLISLAVVGSLEFIAITLAAIEGIYLGLSLFFPKFVYMGKPKRKESFLKTLRETFYIYVLIVVILAVAAVIETTSIFLQSA